MKDDRYLAYLSHFNRDRDYFQCHEVMEELWLEEGRNPLLQGLLQAAVGLHHWDNGNPSGASKLMRAALDKLDGYADAVVGLDLRQLQLDLKASLNTLFGKDASFQAFKLQIHDETLQIAEKWEESHGRVK
ncbi:DUF309 domain-containing protein [Cohnella luojiensis]|uniref:DUF309 domain-containing protein n=2 Tax=Cohnella luojiensis TaxID=652876 RepID=A0A4Y8M807_9BACL|nr:DUF309 domain-containing protein [Cohnella luojiensis]